MKKIEGKRLVLRELSASDLPLVTRWINRPDVAYFMGISTPVTLAQQKRWFKEASADPARKIFAITLRRGGRIIGNIGLREISERDHNAALNIFIGESADRRKGYSREAIMLLLGYCFETLGMNRVWLKLHSDNTAARKLYESCGIKKEGLLREHECYGGKYVDKIVMGILKSEFQK
jgi:RimJ/RimL family protein N-acetyltransferase